MDAGHRVEVAAVAAIMRANRMLAHRIEVALRPYALTHARLNILQALTHAADGQMTAKGLRAVMGTHHTTVGDLINSLVAAGLADRSAHPHDRRLVVVRLTSDGRRRAVEAAEAVDREVYSRLSGDMDCRAVTMALALEK